MQVDFYQLSRDPAEAALAMIAGKVLDAGERLLVVSGDDALTERISEALWTRQPDSFLAHGLSGGPHEGRQPILLSDRTEAGNGARYVALADGRWRDGALAFERVFLLFDEATIEEARATWRSLDGRDGLDRNYWRQEDGRWIKAA
jgi:DNA polymerase-3 subunit chi